MSSAHLDKHNMVSSGRQLSVTGVHSMLLKQFDYILGVWCEPASARTEPLWRLHED